MCVAKTSSWDSRMLVTFSWKAKYSYLFQSFMVFFIKLTSSLTFFFLSPLAPVSSSSISSSYAISFYLLELSFDFWLEVFTDFFTEVDRTGFRGSSLLGSYFFTSYLLTYYFFKLTPELLLLLALLRLLGGALLAGILGGWFGLGTWLVGVFLETPSYFFMFLAEFIFCRCSFENSGFFYSLSFFRLFSSTILLYMSFSQELSLSLSAYRRVLRLWSADELPGEMQAIMTILELSPLAWKESLKISVSLEARKGTWSALSSIALIHYFSANKLHRMMSTFY